MNFLFELDTFNIKIGFLIIFIIGYLIIHRKNNLKLTLQYVLYSYGIAILLLSLSIPHIFSGFPNDISELENKKRLLYHLQRNNEALVETTQAFRDLVFITFLVLVAIISKIIKHFKLENSAE
ncbi:hypothetical protein [Flavobacterium sp.]|uniref:hypothetical protein n=1 Tax=Flavobacterium sp. TaxID=239 RepID=UPI00261937BD|nr:hypothetical protein [Flavobacterium sp.]